MFAELAGSHARRRADSQFARALCAGRVISELMVTGREECRVQACSAHDRLGMRWFARFCAMRVPRLPGC